ncbi:MAG: GntR family transcriptional regulator [Lachnospiraceae bacterium]|nr:GntR family transcriptional regulator [Lachnospiraceae bacterium]
MVSFDGFFLTDKSPIYLQIIRFVKQGIAAGVIGNQEEVPSRRALSALLGVNPNTVQKAFRMLEEEGILVSRLGAKSYTSVDKDTMHRIRRELTLEETGRWVEAMRQLGVGEQEALKLAGELWKKERDG